MPFTAVISIFISELLSDIACLEFISQSPCIMHGNPQLMCHRASVQCPGPAASQEIVHSLQQLPTDRSQQLAKHLGHFKGLFLGSRKNAAVTPSGLSNLEDIIDCGWERHCILQKQYSELQEPFYI